MIQSMKYESGQLELLRWIAIVGMVLDHLLTLGVMRDLFPRGESLQWISTIGRGVFPIFAFLLAHNYVYFTKSKKDYIKRLFYFALISQLFFTHAYGGSLPLNIMFTLTFGLSLVFIIEMIRGDEENIFINKAVLYAGAVLIAAFSYFVDYYIFGVLLIVSAYFIMVGKNKPLWMLFFVSLAIAPNVPLMALGYSMHVIFSIILTLGIILAIKSFNIKIPRSNKWFFYIFYPAHIVVIDMLLRINY